jgi:hypothetical protein
VAFSGTRTAGGQGIYRLPAGGTPAEFANTDGAIANFLNGSVAINSTGSVAFTAALDAGGTGLLLAPAGGSLTQVADTSGQFSALVLGGLNVSGTLAFVGDLTAGGRAVYLFPPGGSLTRIIGNGDALDGSTITGLTFPFASINDAGQIAFAASLADGRQGVFVGTPVPEPTSLALIAVGGLAALRRRRRGCLTRRIADQTQIRTAFCPTALSQERNAMKSMIWLCIAISALAGTNPSYAGVITWASPANISGDADVSTTGTLVGAVHIGDLGIVAATVNGVTFTPFTISSANGSNPITDPSGRFTLSGAAVNGTNAYGSLAAPFSTLSSSYQSLLNGGDFGAGNSLQVLTINNLNPGTTYQFQFWSNDSRGIFHTIVNATAGNTVAVDANVEGNTAGGIGQFAIGTFTADATMQVIDFQGAPGGGTSENAFELRILTVPEPGSGLLVLAALGGYVIRRRRGH